MADINSLDDILNSDTFGLLDDKNEEDIHTLINVPKIDANKFLKKLIFKKLNLTFKKK